ncbi:MAG: amidohydrolase family protein [Chloroflexi bacterium]|nr:amidohydrolase family protein [Chloroflexota bacterium]
MHFFAYAATLLDVELTPAAGVRSVADIVARMAQRARATPPGRWVRGWGYEPFYLAEQRHPTRFDLDRATPRHPVVLHHRTRHAFVLNSEGMRRVGLITETPEPPGALFERAVPAGELTGVVLGAADVLLRRIPEHTDKEMSAAAAQASRRLLSFGVTSFHDATATNTPTDFQGFRRLQATEALRQRVVVMADARQLAAWSAAGLSFGAGAGRLRAGHAKVVLDEVEGAVRPGPRELRGLVQEAYRRGYPMALHCATAESAEAALRALEAARPARPPALRVPDRLEHGSLLPPALDRRWQRLGVAVVTNPAFIWHSGERYRAQVPRAERQMLYRLRSLLESGLLVAAGSDAPVTPPDPRPALYVAVARRDATGAALGLRERANGKQALALFTSAAQALEPSPSPLPLGEGQGEEIGRDRVVWDRDLLRCPARELLQARVLRVEMDGDAVWEAQN